MKVLFAINPLRSNFLYVVPLAWALRAAGHDVRIASQPGFTDTITQAGLTAVPVGRDRDLSRRLLSGGFTTQVLMADRPGLGSPYDLVERPEEATWERTRTEHAIAMRAWHKPENFPIIADLVRYAQYWQPDLVVWEPLTLAGPIAAAACGAAHGRVLWSVDVFALSRRDYLDLLSRQPADDRPDPVREWFTGYGRRYGFDYSEDLVTGQFTIDQLPPSLGWRADLDYLSMRHVPYAGPAVVPQWLREPPRRPRVAFTMGLSATEIYRSYPVSMREILDALGDLDVEIVAQVDNSHREALGPVPGNVRVVPFVPWHTLIPTCSAVVHHAGAATLATTSLHPVPQLALHYHWDQPILARKLAEHGAGLEIPTPQATGEAVRAALHRLLTEPLFQKRAKALSEEMHALPAPTHLVPDLERLAVKHRSR